MDTKQVILELRTQKGMSPVSYTHLNVNMFYDDLNTEEQVSYLIKPILQVLQEAGGQLERSEIRERISELDLSLIHI